MCLINTFETTEFKVKKFYKILRKYNNALFSPFYNMIWNAGVNKCGGFSLVKTNSKDSKVSQGIHVFATEDDAKSYKIYMEVGYFDIYELVIVPVYAESEDLIASGYQEGYPDIKTLCFKQVYLNLEDYEKALTNTKTEVQ